MSGKILRRCSICKRFHASYLVEDPQQGKQYLCYSCWKTIQVPSSLSPLEPKTEIQVADSTKGSAG